MHREFTLMNGLDGSGQRATRSLFDGILLSVLSISGFNYVLQQILQRKVFLWRDKNMGWTRLPTMLLLVLQCHFSLCRNHRLYDPSLVSGRPSQATYTVFGTFSAVRAQTRLCAWNFFLLGISKLSHSLLIYAIRNPSNPLLQK